MTRFKKLDLRPDGQYGTCGDASAVSRRGRLGRCVCVGRKHKSFPSTALPGARRRTLPLIAPWSTSKAPRNVHDT
ncbi:hypothetical protein EVAR_44278_1 [Eumeta japonica]|uniref:Uncharacterized protein n=1 Tax=Eumeta variegata TaxID=151549 RepID=A0A4C1WT24_EUMVA|nr:hypothetical protein EVAR_44278_1 [Eumeta japonica]